jgi:hypothetical protein
MIPRLLKPLSARRRTARLALGAALVLLAGAGTVFSAAPAQAVASGCTADLPTRIGGSIYGYPDNNAVNALIGLDLKSGGATVNVDGSLRTTAGYGLVQRVNQTLPATGSATGTKSWGACVAGNVDQVFIEVYPQNANLQTDRTRYGGASHYRQPISSGVSNDVLLRLPVRYEAGSNATGYVNGYITYNGARVDPAKITRVRAFSTGSGPDCGIEGFQADADELAYSGSLNATYYRLGVLAGGRCGAATQQYQITIECTDVCGQVGKRALQRLADVSSSAGIRIDFAF